MAWETPSYNRDSNYKFLVEIKIQTIKTVKL